MPQEIRNISVLMPTYNCAQYITFAIKSILNQTFRGYEFLIIDDGSLDNTEDIVSGFKDSRIRYIKKEHSGLASSLNYGLSLCTYDWVARMDADDICSENRFAEQLRNLTPEINNISCTWSIYFKGRKPYYYIQTPVKEENLRNKMLLHNYICHSSVIFNKSFILNSGGYDKNLLVFEDYEIWLRLINNSSFFVIGKYLLYVRIRDLSLSRYNYEKHKLIIYKLQKKNASGQVFNSLSFIEKQMLFGWQEFFYGSKNCARNEWLKLNIRQLLNIRLIVACFITYFPQKIVDRFNNSKFVPRIFMLLSFMHHRFRKMLAKLTK
jgi:glycosyltransferase involved in cell wall biosynthesis